MKKAVFAIAFLLAGSVHAGNTSVDTYHGSVADSDGNKLEVNSRVNRHGTFYTLTASDKHAIDFVLLSYSREDLVKLRGYLDEALAVQ